MVKGMSEAMDLVVYLCLFIMWQSGRETMDLVAFKESKVVVTMKNTAKVERGSVWTMPRHQLDVHLK